MYLFIYFSNQKQVNVNLKRRAIISILITQLHSKIIHQGTCTPVTILH